MRRRIICFIGILLSLIAVNTISVMANTEQEQVVSEYVEVSDNKTYLIGGYRYIDGKTHKMGDVSADDRITARDALALLKHSAVIEPINTSLEIVADVDLDGSITASDALTVLKYSAKLLSATEGIVHLPAWITSENASEYSVEGTPVTVETLNGAIEHNDSNGVIYEFTDENKNNNVGIELVNPIKGNTELIHDYGYLYDLSKDGLINAFHLYGSELGWGRDEEKLPNTATQFPSYYDPMCWYMYNTNKVYYPKADIHKGFSVSFWSNADYSNGDTPTIVFADDKQTLAVTLNAGVTYTDSIEAKNRFIAKQSVDNPNYISGKWHYYTVTFANDWICVYIDGLEVVYDELELDRAQAGFFNDGFLTRYNAVITWTQEDFDNDWRGYLISQKSSDSEYDVYNILSSNRYTVWGNGRYRGLNAGGELLLTFMTNEATKVYIGGADVEIAPETAKYASESGAQVAQIEYYLDELNWEQVYANYLMAKEPVIE